MHHLPRDELGDREPDDIDGLVDVGDDTSHLCAGEAARFGAQAEHDLVAVDGVDVKVDGDSGGSGCCQLIEEYRARLTQLVGADGLQTPLGDVWIVVVAGVEPNQGDPARCNGRGEAPPVHRDHRAR